jgi:hypothetical protein
MQFVSVGREAIMRSVLFPITVALSVIVSGPVGAKVGMHLGADALSEASDVHFVKKGKYKVKYKWQRGNCKYEYKADHKGVKEKYKCK